MTETLLQPALAEALHLFQAELPRVHKGNRAVVPTKSGGQYTYTYADLTDVTAAAIPRLHEFGLTFTSRPRLTPSGGYELVGVLRHVSGEYDEGAMPLFGREMQELGGSLTYARRYLLGCMTGIVTDDDEDGAFTASPGRTVQEDRPPAAQAPPLPQPRPLPTTTDPIQLGMTAELIQDLEGIAGRQDPPRDLAWITTKLRREAGNLEVAALYELEPSPLAELVDRWNGQASA
jgi:hypothetical protein